MWAVIFFFFMLPAVIIGALIYAVLAWTQILFKRCPVCRTRCPSDYHFCPNCRYEYRVTRQGVARLTPPHWFQRIMWIFVAALLLCGMPTVVISFVLTAPPPPPISGQETPLPSPTPVPVVDIVIATQNISRGMQITPDVVRLTPWSYQSIPDNAIYNLEDVIGEIAIQDIYREMPFTTSLITDTTSFTQVDSNPDARPILQPFGTSQEFYYYDDYQELNDRFYYGGSYQAYLPPALATPITLNHYSLAYWNSSLLFTLDQRNWNVEGLMTGVAGEHLQFTVMPVDLALSNAPALFLWHDATEQYIEGRYERFDAGAARLTVTLPESGVYILSVVNTSLLRGTPSGRFALTLRRITYEEGIDGNQLSTGGAF